MNIEYENLGQLPRGDADTVLRELVTPLSYKLRDSVWRAYESHLTALLFALRKGRIARPPAQLEEIILVIAFAAFNRLIMLQMRGFATFGRRLSRRHDISTLVVGNAAFKAADFEELRDLAISFQRYLQRCGIPKYMLEYPDVPRLMLEYDKALNQEAQ